MILLLGCLIFIAKGANSDQDFTLAPIYRECDDLASAVQDAVATSSVLIVNAGCYEDLAETVLMAKMSREFSSKDVFFQNVNFARMYDQHKYYNSRDVQPLFVVMLKSMDDMNQFANITKLYNMGFHVWLVIFVRSSLETLDNYCRRPRENLFNLVISSKMIVKCYDDLLLKEWYSIDAKTVDTFVYGKYSPEDKRIVKPADDRFYERRSNLKGISLKVASVTESMPFHGWNSTMDSFFGLVLKELSDIMNFTIDYYSVETSYGSYNLTTHQWTGIVGKLVNREIDIGIGELTINHYRAAVIDFTIPLMLTTSDIYIRRPDMSNVDWSAYIKAFHKDIWLIIVLTLLVTPILLAIMWKVIKGCDMTHRLGEEYLCIWGIYCQKPLDDFPVASSLRLAYISILMSSLVLFAVYLAYLTSYLTIFKPHLPFDTFRGFVQDGTYQLIVLRHSSNHDLFTRIQVPILRDMGKLLKRDSELPLDLFSAVSQVCNEKVAFYTNQLLIEKINRYAPCELMALTQGKLDNVGLGLVKNSPYTEIFNYNLKHLLSYGIIECLKRRYLEKSKTAQLAYLPVEFSEIIPVLGVLGLGVIVAFTVLMCEYVFHDKKKKSRTLEGIRTKV